MIVLTLIFALVCVSRTQHCRMQIAMRRSRTTKVYVRLIGLFLICVIPICIWNITISENKLITPVNQILGIILYCIYWQQYLLNCLIYFFDSPNYQNACGQLFARITCREIIPKIEPNVRRSTFPCDTYVISIGDGDTVEEFSIVSKNSITDSKLHPNENSHSYKYGLRLPKGSITSQWSFSGFSNSSEGSQYDVLSVAVRKRSSSLNDIRTAQFLKLRRQLSC